MKICPQTVEQTVHKNTGRSHTSSDERHNAEERTEVGHGQARRRKGGLALGEEVRYAFRGDADSHVVCIEKDAKEHHGCGGRTVLLRGGLKAEVEEQVIKGSECLSGIGRNFSAPEVVDVVRTSKTEGTEHESDRGSGALAHHRG